MHDSTHGPRRHRATRAACLPSTPKAFLPRPRGRLRGRVGINYVREWRDSSVLPPLHHSNAILPNCAIKTRCSRYGVPRFLQRNHDCHHVECRRLHLHSESFISPRVVARIELRMFGISGPEILTSST